MEDNEKKPLKVEEVDRLTVKTFLDSVESAKLPDAELCFALNGIILPVQDVAVNVKKDLSAVMVELRIPAVVQRIPIPIGQMDEDEEEEEKDLLN